MKIRINPPDKIANRPATIDLEPEHAGDMYTLEKLYREHTGCVSGIGRYPYTSAIKYLRLQIVEQPQG